MPILTYSGSSHLRAHWLHVMDAPREHPQRLHEGILVAKGARLNGVKRTTLPRLLAA